MTLQLKVFCPQNGDIMPVAPVRTLGLLSFLDDSELTKLSRETDTFLESLATERQKRIEQWRASERPSRRWVPSHPIPECCPYCGETEFATIEHPNGTHLLNECMCCGYKDGAAMDKPAIQ